MSWWKRFGRGGSELDSGERFRAVRLTLPGWVEQAPEDGLCVWRDPPNDILSLAIPDDYLELPNLSDMSVVRSWSRSLAESRGAGLIEARVSDGEHGVALGLIYKRLDKPAYLFTGMLFVPSQNHVWTVVAGERGMTGGREATVTTELANDGELTPQNYESYWRDPYDPSYSGVHVSVLRFISDDESYDERFPAHPLSKVRRVMAALPNSVQVAS
jgi:hypothetical protein